MKSSTGAACDWLRQHAGENAAADFQLRYAAGQSIETALRAVTTLTKREVSELIRSNFGFTKEEEQ